MYRVHLKDFEGPLDLLLFFIRRDELDIYDIPIARITDEYLAYLHVLEEIDLDGAGEFIYFAALLISIKARMLLPPQGGNDEDEEPVDPRKELVDRLLEYMRFKEAADQLTMQHDHRDALFTRRAALAELQRYAEDPDSLTYEVSVFQLISALKRVLSTAPVEPQSHLVRPLAYSIEEQRTFVLQALNPEHPVAFEALVARKTKAFIIATFLAILEIAREGLVRILLNKTEHHTFYLAVCS